ncbi:PREDICTED: sulfate transporter 2.1-like [Prunus mume]|uniref:Sulfate transporter 2.1-like n=1 Tax=Prunus mume TaxID=102107 RepID=A0ABM0PX98_PRUMU|nr:PREDICTED: sulfate transporter 2.1-like [Prunus mume]
MVGSTICTLEELFDMENNMAGRSQRVLNPPQPPGLWHELVDFMRESVLPHRNKLLSSNQRGTKRSILVFKCWFLILCWCQNYHLKTFKNDLIAGLTLASLCIPQSMGYATLTHLEPQYGLYTSIIPPLIYAMMGSSRDLVIGAVAVDSLLLSSMILESYPGVDAINYKKSFFTTTLFAGVFQTACGVFRLGFLVDFLSHAAIIGFVAGATIIIDLQQLQGLFGIKHFTNKTDST